MSSNASEICSLLNLIKDVNLLEVSRAEQNINLKLRLDKSYAAPEQDFFATLENCSDFFLQPFRNDRTLITDLKEINQLELRLHFSEAAMGGKVKVHCSYNPSDYSGTLFFKCEEFRIYNSAFDRLNASDLLHLTGQGNLE